MKTKNGFVSNSSSSSFIIFYPKEYNVSEVILLPGGINTFQGYHNDVYTRGEVMDFFKKEFHKKTPDELRELLQGEYDDVEIEKMIGRSELEDIYYAEVEDNCEFYSAFEGRILPMISDIVISHH